MADERWQGLLRAWRSSGAPDLLEQVVEVGLQQGQAIGDVLDARIRAPRTFTSEREYRVFSVVAPGEERAKGKRPKSPDAPRGWGLVNGCADYASFSRRGNFTFLGHRVELLGATPGEVQVPRHRLWWIDPVGKLGAKRIRGIARELADAEVAGVNLGGSQVKDADLEPLGEVECLESLLLAHAPRLTGSALKALPPRLRFLSLRDTKRIEDGDFAALVRYRYLTFLDASDSQRYRSAGQLAALARLPQLTHLQTLGLKGMQGAAVEALLPLIQLRALAVGGHGAFSAKGLEVLAQLPHLERLMVHLPKKSRVGALKALGALQGLVHLHLRFHVDGDRGHQATRGDFAFLRDLPRLQTLWLDGPMSFPDRNRVRGVVPHVHVRDGGPRTPRGWG